APRILQSLCTGLDWQTGEFWTIDHVEGVIRCIEFWRAPGAGCDEFEMVSRKLTLKHGAGLPGRVWACGVPTWIADIASDDNFPRGDVAVRAGLRCGLGFPISVGNRVLGAISVYSCRVQQVDPDLLEMLATIGAQIGQFIERRTAERENARL